MCSIDHPESKKWMKNSSKNTNWRSGLRVSRVNFCQADDKHGGKRFRRFSYQRKQRSPEQPQQGNLGEPWKFVSREARARHSDAVLGWGWVRSGEELRVRHRVSSHFWVKWRYGCGKFDISSFSCSEWAGVLQFALNSTGTDRWHAFITDCAKSL